MNNFPTFLEGPGPNMPMPRQAPSPSPSAAAAAAAAQHQNGMGSMGQPNGGIPLINGLPSGGQQTDMNHLWTVVQQLSQVLEENRAHTLGIVNGVQAIQARAVEEGGLGSLAPREVNGEPNAASRTADIQALTTQLSHAQTQISELSSSNASFINLITDYENAITRVLDLLRPYAYNHTQIVLGLHKQYQELLDKERATSMQIRLEHAEWQAGLGRVAQFARAALEAQSEGDMPYKRELKELREENRVLRRLAGWEERPGDSSDEDGEEGKVS